MAGNQTWSFLFNVYSRTRDMKEYYGEKSATGYARSVSMRFCSAFLFSFSSRPVQHFEAFVFTAQQRERGLEVEYDLHSKRILLERYRDMY